MESKKENILAEFSRARLNEEAVNIEKVYFYKTDKRVNPKQEDPLWFAIGNLPILVSAPHAVRHFRQKKIKMSDQCTGSIAYLLHRLTSCHAIATTKLYGGDPNTDNPCIYKEKITDFCRSKKVKFLLDIHGAARERNFDIDLGTNQRKNLLGKEKALGVLETNFHDFGLCKITYDHFPASSSNTIAYYVAHQLGIPAVQIEINKHYRVPTQNPQGFHRLMGALVQSINNLA